MRWTQLKLKPGEYCLILPSEILIKAHELMIEEEYETPEELQSVIDMGIEQGYFGNNGSFEKDTCRRYHNCEYYEFRCAV
jgi:hypothetical protein